MPTSLPAWAPKVKPYLIKRLYENDANGTPDETLLDEVGWALMARAESFVHAMDAAQGHVHCPACGTVIETPVTSKTFVRCPACGWGCPYRDYLGTLRSQQLNGGPEVVALFQDYLDHFPQAGTPAEKMLRIDALIHGFHHYLTSGRARRPVGVNLIAGDLNFVVDFLDGLTFGPASTPGLEQSKVVWREKLRHTTRKT